MCQATVNHREYLAEVCKNGCTDRDAVWGGADLRVHIGTTWGIRLNVQLYTHYRATAHIQMGQLTGRRRSRAVRVSH